MMTKASKKNTTIQRYGYGHLPVRILLLLTMILWHHLQPINAFVNHQHGTKSSSSLPLLLFQQEALERIYSYGKFHQSIDSTKRRRRRRRRNTKRNGTLVVPYSHAPSSSLAISSTTTTTLFMSQADSSADVVDSSSGSSKTSNNNWWKQLRQRVQQSSTMIKKKGSAGLLAYSLFNCILYSIGMTWEWQRMGIPVYNNINNHHQHISTAMAWRMVLEKCGRVFAKIFVLSNLIKLPKIFTVTALLPFTERMIQQCQSILSGGSSSTVSEQRALAVCVLVLVMLWSIAIAIPMVSDYTAILMTCR